MHKMDVNTKNPKTQRGTGKATELPGSIEMLGAITTIYGAQVHIPMGQALNYAGVKAEQLRHLLQMMIGPDFNERDDKQREAITIMAFSMAEELDSLISMVDADAALEIAAEKGGA